MKITIGDHVIVSDGICITLYAEKIREEGKNVGEKYLAIIGHFPNLSQTCNRLLEEKISSSEATIIDELRYDIQNYQNEVLTAINGG